MYKKIETIPSSLGVVRRKPKLLSMKLALALMFAGIIHVSATSLGQTVTLSKKNVPMGTVLKDLQKQSGYNIFYDDNLVPENLRVSINLKNQPLDQALDDLLSQHGLDYHLVENNIILRKAQAKTVVQTDSPTIEKIVKQQQFRISGQVHDAQGHPLSNVSVKEKEATPSTMTDQNGDYTLQISTPDAIIEFSSIGYQKQEIALDDQTVLNITMKPMLTEVDEVVVVGYGEQKKVNLTGAVSQISGEEFEDRPVTQLTQALQGAVPNLNVVFGSGQPGTSGSVNVRGNTSINGGGPLILIDGILGTLDRVNVNDVESVTVLKDASAAAVYGARGAFGVILVTTKQGKEDGTASIDYSTNVGYTSHATNTDFITSGYWNAKINDDAMYNALGYRATRYSDEDYEELWARVDDKTEHPDRPWVVTKQDASGNDIYRYYANFDWFNYLYDDKRPKSDHNLSLTGKSGNTNYALSGALSDEQGIFNINPDQYKRYNLRANLVSEIRPWLTVSNGTHYFKSSYDWHGLSNNFNQVANNVSNSPTYHYHAMYVPRNPDGTLTGYSGINSYPIGYGMHNALESGTMRGYNRGTEFTNKTEAVVNFGHGLTLTGNYSYREFRSEHSYRQTKQYYSKYPGIMELIIFRRTQPG